MAEHSATGPAQPPEQPATQADLYRVAAFLREIDRMLHPAGARPRAEYRLAPQPLPPLPTGTATSDGHHVARSAAWQGTRAPAVPAPLRTPDLPWVEPPDVDGGHGPPATAVPPAPAAVDAPTSEPRPQSRSAEVTTPSRNARAGRSIGAATAPAARTPRSAPPGEPAPPRPSPAVAGPDEQATDTPPPRPATPAFEPAGHGAVRAGTGPEDSALRAALPHDRADTPAHGVVAAARRTRPDPAGSGAEEPKAAHGQPIPARSTPPDPVRGEGAAPAPTELDAIAAGPAPADPVTIEVALPLEPPEEAGSTPPAPEQVVLRDHTPPRLSPPGAPTPPSHPGPRSAPEALPPEVARRVRGDLERHYFDRSARRLR